MIAQAILRTNPEEGIRPFDMRRDLLQLADLIELAFESDLDRARNPIVAEMRRLAKAGPLLWFLDAPYAALSPFMGGFVWVAQRRLVGNVTLSPESGQRGLWSISNVAVHPDCRGLGIAHQLIEAALQEARNKGAQSVVLEVQTDNAPAQQLYRELGFQAYDTVIELSLPSPRWTGWRVPPAVPLRKRRPGDWQSLYELCKAATPAKAQVVKPLVAQQYRMSIELRLERWLDDLLYHRQSSDWVLEENGQVVALLQITGQYTGAAHRLQMDVHPGRRGTIEDDLLAAGLCRLSRFPDREIVSTVSASHPEALQAFQHAGFRTGRILDQMQLSFQRSKERMS